MRTDDDPHYVDPFRRLLKRATSQLMTTDREHMVLTPKRRAIWKQLQLYCHRLGHPISDERLIELASR
ncbi:MAG: hypothetical protein R3E01_10415 [Pirellulaceae bacterium]